VKKKFAIDHALRTSHTITKTTIIVPTKPIANIIPPEVGFQNNNVNRSRGSDDVQSLTYDRDPFIERNEENNGCAVLVAVHYLHTLQRLHS
jgi:hypothetical protein